MEFFYSLSKDDIKKAYFYHLDTTPKYLKRRNDLIASTVSYFLAFTLSGLLFKVIFNDPIIFWALTLLFLSLYIHKNFIKKYTNEYYYKKFIRNFSKENLISLSAVKKFTLSSTDITISLKSEESKVLYFDEIEKIVIHSYLIYFYENGSQFDVISIKDLPSDLRQELLRVITTIKERYNI